MDETPFRVEPMLIEDGVPNVLVDLMTDIQSEVGALGQGLHPASLEELADLVRVVNCYYSNLIEGHDTRPKDIELALGGLAVEQERRPLALEARAHVLVQRRIDEAFRDGTLASPTSVAFLTWVHEAFYAEVPEELRVMRHPDGSMRPVIPGRFRNDPREDVSVGRHVPPSSAMVDAFMRHFEDRFRKAEARSGSRMIAIATAHHRLNFIHPFLDGNGRVSRLMSHAMALRAGIGGSGLWSISRGFARGLGDRGEYMRMMDMADAVRQGSRDGRGNLSQARLTDFCEWTFCVMLDQIRFAKAAFTLQTLEGRYRGLLRDLGYDRKAEELVSTVMRFGELRRGEAPLVMSLPERTARVTLSRLVTDGFLKSSTPKGPVRLGFPLEYRERLFPNLFAGEPVEAPDPPIPSWRR